jgi:hypothetical protein
MWLSAPPTAEENAAITAVPQLLYPKTTALKWHFPQENATLHDARKGTLILEPL